MSGASRTDPRTLIVTAPVVGLILCLALASCNSNGSSEQLQALQKSANIYAISQIETKWHEASSTHNIDLMMSLWANDATFTVGSQVLTGTDQIRNFFLKEAAPFQAQNHWVSDSPAYKEKITVTGNTGTLYFECDYIDVNTQKVVAVVSADQDVALIGGKWLITNSVAATPKFTANPNTGY